MRLAVALPSLPAGALHRQSLEATLAELNSGGVEVEGFAERERLHEPPPGFPLHHYLRMPERHRRRSFDMALYPLGRDAGPYQAACWLMLQYPGIVWLFDTVFHHLVLGGVALKDNWGSYREVLEGLYGDAGAALAHAVAGGWGTGAVFRRYDLAAAVTADMPGLLATWPALAERLSARLSGREVPLVPLPLVPERRRWQTASGRGEGFQLALMTTEPSYPYSAIEAASELLRLDGVQRVTFCTSEQAYSTKARPAARRRGVHDRIEWALDPGWDRLAAIAGEADVVAWLRSDLQLGERLLLLHGLAAGKLTVVARCALYDDLPEGVVAKTDLGRALPPTLTSIVRQLGDDDRLRDGVRDAARRFAEDSPDAATAAAALRQELEALSGSFRPAKLGLSRNTWRALQGDLTDAAITTGVGLATRRLLTQRLEALLESSLGRTDRHVP